MKPTHIIRNETAQGFEVVAPKGTPPRFAADFGLPRNAIPEKYHLSISSLATSYKAFMASCERSNSSGVITWGRLLLDDQKSTGVVLVPRKALLDTIKTHQARVDAVSIQRAA